MKKIILFLFCILFAQESYEGQITFDYNGTVDGSFTSIVQDSITTGFAYNQMGLDTSYFIMGSFTEQENSEYDLFFTVLQDTTFPVQPRTWEIPGQGDEEDPLSLETIVVLMPGMDSSFVAELVEFFTDTSNTVDSLDLTAILTEVFLELADDLYLGLAGELEITDVTDSTVVGNFYTTIIKPVFHIPPHIVMINNGEFNFDKVSLPDLSISKKPTNPKSISLYSAYPNPFNPTTTLRFNNDSGSNTNVLLQILDINGRWVENLVFGELKTGANKIQWHAGNQPSGIYFAVLQSGNMVQTTKLILIK